MSKDEAIKDAEAFVRKAIARTSDKDVDEKKIRAAARKIARVLPKRQQESAVAA